MYICNANLIQLHSKSNLARYCEIGEYLCTKISRRHTTIPITSTIIVVILTKFRATSEFLISLHIRDHQLLEFNIEKSG